MAAVLRNNSITSRKTSNITHLLFPSAPLTSIIYSVFPPVHPSLSVIPVSFIRSSLTNHLNLFFFLVVRLLFVSHVCLSDLVLSSICGLFYHLFPDSTSIIHPLSHSLGSNHPSCSRWLSVHLTCRSFTKLSFLSLWSSPFHFPPIIVNSSTDSFPCLLSCGSFMAFFLRRFTLFSS